MPSIPEFRHDMPLGIVADWCDCADMDDEAAYLRQLELSPMLLHQKWWQKRSGSAHPCCLYRNSSSSQRHSQTTKQRI